MLALGLTPKPLKSVVSTRCSWKQVFWHDTQWVAGLSLSDTAGNRCMGHGDIPLGRQKDKPMGWMRSCLSIPQVWETFPGGKSLTQGYQEDPTTPPSTVGIFWQGMSGGVINGFSTLQAGFLQTDKHKAITALRFPPLWCEPNLARGYTHSKADTAAAC